METRAFTPLRFESMTPSTQFSLDPSPGRDLMISDFKAQILHDLRRIDDQTRERTSRNMSRLQTEELVAQRNEPKTAMSDLIQNASGNDENDEVDTNTSSFMANSSERTMRLRPARSAAPVSLTLTFPPLPPDNTSSDSELIFAKWSIKRLGQIFQLHPDLTPRQWTAPAIQIMGEIAQLIDRKSAELKLNEIVKERLRKEKERNAAHPRSRFSSRDGTVLLELLRTGDEEQEVAIPSTNGHISPSDDRQTGRLTNLELHDESHPTQAVDHAATANSDQDSRSELSMPLGSRRRHPTNQAGATSTSSRNLSQHPSEETQEREDDTRASSSTTATTPAPTARASLGNPGRELGHIYPEIVLRKAEFDAAEAAHQEAQDEWQRVDKKLRTASENFEQAKRRKLELKGHVQSLVRRLPDDIGNELKDFYEGLTG